MLITEIGMFVWEREREREKKEWFNNLLHWSYEKNDLLNRTIVVLFHYIETLDRLTKQLEALIK